jgi:hypothetical protein
MFIKGDIFKDFWEQNPEMAVITPFNELKPQKGSSKIMWAIYQIYDPKAILHVYKESDRIEEVKGNYYDIDLEKNKECIEAYKDLCISPLEKEYQSWEDEVMKTQEFIRLANWDTRTIGNKIKALKDLDAIFLKCAALRDKIFMDREVSSNQGDYQESGIEGGGLFGFIKQ